MKAIRGQLGVFALMILVCGAGAQTTERYSYNNLNKAIPDGSRAGLVDVHTLVSSIRNLSAVRVKLNVAGQYNGDLYAYVRHINDQTTNFCVLLNRPGRSSVRPAGYGDAGIDITFDSAAANDLHLYRNFTNVPSGAALTGTWQPDGRAADPLQVLDTSNRSTSLATFNGPDASGEWTLFIADVDAGATNLLVSWELELVGAIAPPLAWQAPANIIYGTVLGPTQLSATAGGVAGTLVYTPPSGTALTAGIGQVLSVTFIPSDSSNFVPVSTNVLLNVLRAPLIVTADNTNRFYGDANPVFTGSIFGIKYSDLITASYSCVATPASVAGPYPIVPAALGSRLTNYNVIPINGTLTVKPAALIVAGSSANRLYGDANPLFTGTISGIKNGENITATYTCSAGLASPIGNYNIVPTPLGVTLGNYNVTLINGTLTVNPAALTVTGSNTNRLYGDPNPVFTGTIAGIKNGENITASYNCSATPASPVGAYNIVPSPAGATLGNYSITLINGRLTVNAAALIIAAANTNRFYGDANPAFTGTITGIKNGDSVTAAYNCNATPVSPVGNYSVIPSLSGTNLGNYSITKVNGTLTVNAATLTLAAVSTNRFYGDANPVFTGTISGIKNGDSITDTYSCAATLTSPIGYYIIIPNASGAALANYELTVVNGTLAVIPAPLTVTGSNTNRLYGDPNPAFTGSITGIKNGEAITATYFCSASLASPIGSYNIIPNPSGGTLANYSLTVVNGTLTVNAAPLAVTAANTNRLYGDPNPAFTGTITGVKNAETITATYTCSATPASGVGKYAIIPILAGATLGNYSVTKVNGFLTVNPSALIVAAANTNRFYGNANPVFTGTITGVKNGETIRATYSCSATPASPVGSYNIIPSASGSTLANYNLTLVNGALIVNAAPLTVAATSTERFYGDANPVFSGTITGIKNGETIAATYSCSATPASPPGPYNIVPTASGTTLANYSVTRVNGTLTVNAAPLTVTAANANRLYGTPNPVFAGTITGVKNSESITATYGCSATLTTPAGSYDIVPALSGATLGNYAVTAVKGTLTITRAASTGVVSSSPNPQVPGQPVTFSCALAAAPPTVGTPAGSVQFRIDGAAAGSPVSVVGGVASYTTATLSVGNHTVVAEYPGNANFTGTTNALPAYQSINTPPVAHDDTIERYPTEGVKVELAGLLANDSDADGDVVSFVAASTTSANGGTITRQDDWLFYRPRPGFTNVDSFTYTITDGRGTLVTGTVNVRLKPDQGPALNLAITDLGNGSYLLRFSGIPNRQTVIQYSPTLNPADWKTLASGTSDSVGLFECTDAPPGGLSSRFYRGLYP